MFDTRSKRAAADTEYSCRRFWVWHGSIEASSRGKLSSAKFFMSKLAMRMHAKRWMGQKVLVDCHVNSQAPKCNLDCHTEARNHSTFEL